MKNDNNFDYNKLADEFTEFKTKEQIEAADEKILEYINYVYLQNIEYAQELIIRLKKDELFKKQMMNSVIQLSCLLTSSLIETVFMYDNVFPIVKKKSENDYDDVKKFKRYLLDKFSLTEIENELNFTFNQETLNIFRKRFSEIKEYFNKK